MFDRSDRLPCSCRILKSVFADLHDNVMLKQFAKILQHRSDDFAKTRVILLFRDRNGPILERLKKYVVQGQPAKEMSRNISNGML